MKDIKLVIFDMDGLMFDTEKISLSSWLEVGKSSGYELSEDIILQLVGLNRVDGGKVFRTHFGEQFPFEEMLERRMQHSENFILENGVPIKTGLFELLDTLDNLGIKKAVATSTARAKAEIILSKAGILNRFDTIICGDEITRGKPEPEIFLKACERLNVSTEDAVVLEDSEMGLLAAHKGGIKCIIIPDIKPPSLQYEKHAFKKVMSLTEVKHMLQD
jgi:HAD superfamily hydrolase (TIGR01509 family)